MVPASGQALQQQGASVRAVPLVGDGALPAGELPIAGRTQSFSTGGLGYASFAGRLKEILQGQVLYLLKRSWRLLQEARHADGIVVVGDVIPVILAWLERQTGDHLSGGLLQPLRRPFAAAVACRPCLASKRFAAVFSRDALSASDLSEQLGRPVEFLGNPFMDGLVALDASERSGRVLLPGSRLPEARQNLERMLALLEELPAGLRKHDFQAALVRELPAAAGKLWPPAAAGARQQHQPQPLLKRWAGAAMLLGAIHHPASSGAGGGVDGGHRQRAGRRFGQAGAATRRPWPAIHRGLC